MKVISQALDDPGKQFHSDIYSDIKLWESDLMKRWASPRATLKIIK